MSQVSGIAATADRRSLWRVLRPVLLLGGFVAVWWAMATGVAHADTSPHGLADSVRSATKAHHSSPVRDVVRRAHHDAGSNASKVVTRVRHQATHVNRVVSSTVQSTPVAEVTTEVTRTVRAKVSDNVAKARSVLTKMAPGSVVGTVGDTAKKTAKKAESSTGQGNSRPRHHATKVSASSSMGQLHSVSGQQPQPSAATDQERSSIEADLPLDDPGSTPPVHGPCTSPEGSSSTSITPVGVTESSLLVMPSVVRDLVTWRLARQPGGPAYQPGSSPD